MSVNPTPTAGGDATVLDVNDIYDMIGKVGRQIIRGAYAGNPMSVFDKGYLATGDTIEDMVLKMAASWRSRLSRRASRANSCGISANGLTSSSGRMSGTAMPVP